MSNALPILGNIVRHYDATYANAALNAGNNEAGATLTIYVGKGARLYYSVKPKFRGLNNPVLDAKETFKQEYRSNGRSIFGTDDVYDRYANSWLTLASPYK